MSVRLRWIRTLRWSEMSSWMAGWIDCDEHRGGGGGGKWWIGESCIASLRDVNKGGL